MQAIRQGCESDDDSHIPQRPKACSVNEAGKTTTESTTFMGVQRRQPSKQQKCRYGRKCFRRDVQHFKQFRHPKVSYCEPSLRDEEENRHEDESKDRADGRTITAELQENVIDIEVNGKWDHYDKPVCRFGMACFNRNGHHLNFKHPPTTRTKKEENHIPQGRQKERDFIIYRSTTARPRHREDAWAPRARVF
ncbi:hypothetical protein MTO96_020262 [Rhipicephalus appendiculatus]